MPESENNQKMADAVRKIAELAKSEFLKTVCRDALAAGTDYALKEALVVARNTHGEDVHVMITAHYALGGHGSWST